MLELLEEKKKYVIVKMDIRTYQNLGKQSKRQEHLDLVKEAENSKPLNSHKELMDELNS